MVRKGMALLLALLFSMALAQDDAADIILGSVGVMPIQCEIPEEYQPNMEAAWCGSADFMGWIEFNARFDAALNALPVYRYDGWSVQPAGIWMLEFMLQDRSHYLVAVAEYQNRLVLLLTRVRETL